MRYLLLLAFVAPFYSDAQPIERCSSSTLGSWFTTAARSASGTWLLAGGTYDEWSYQFPCFMQEFSPTGELLQEWPVPGNGEEVVSVTKLLPRADGSCIAAGGLQPICDTGGEFGSIWCLQNGVSLWQHTYGIHRFYSAAKNDSLLVFLSSGGLLFTDHQGDSLRTTTFPVGTSNNTVINIIDGFAVCGNTGIHKILPDGQIGAIVQNMNVRDLVQLDEGGFIALTSDSIIGLDGGLNRNGNALPFTTLGPRYLRNSDDDVFIIALDTLHRTTPDLDWITGTSLGRAWQTYFFAPGYGYGFTPSDATVSGDTLMIIGNYRSQVPNAAFRTYSTTQLDNTLPTDAALHDLRIDSIPYVQGSINLQCELYGRVWLLNMGTTTLTNVILNYTYPYAICGTSGEFVRYDDLLVAPGDSIALDFGPLEIYIPSYYENTADGYEMCFWANSPNNRVDRDPSNSFSCTHVLADLTLTLNETAASGDDRLYPSPTSGRIYWSGSFNAKQSISFTFMDMQGRTALEHTVAPSTGPTTLDISDLASGTYIVTIVQGDKRSTHRLVVE